MLLPPSVYLVVHTFLALWVLVYGPATKMTKLGPILGICQLYYSVFPLFLPVHKVCHPISCVWSTADDPCITSLLPMCRNRSEVHMYIWQRFRQRTLAPLSWRLL